MKETREKKEKNKYSKRICFITAFNQLGVNKQNITRNFYKKKQNISSAHKIGGRKTSDIYSTSTATKSNGNIAAC